MRGIIKRLNEASLNQGLVISANKSYGKTNSLQVLLSKQPRNVIDIVIDYATQHCFKLGEKFQVEFMSKDYWLRNPHIRVTCDKILDFSQTTKKTAGEIVRDMIKQEYDLRVAQVIESFRLGLPRTVKAPWFRYWFEESQDLIGRYLKSDDDLKTVFCVGRNFKLSFGFLTQRLADLNTQLVERSAFLVGRQTGDNNLRKISSTFGLPRRKVKFIESLPVGDFVFYSGVRIEHIKFPLFEGEGRAYELASSVVRKRSRLGGLLNSR